MMKPLHYRFSILLMLGVLWCGSLAAQDLSYLPEGLRKLSPEELVYEDLHLVGLPLYMNGKRVSYKEGPKMKADPAYMLDYYVDKKGDIKAVVIRPSTDEERDIKEDANSLQPDPAGWMNALPPEFVVTDIDGNEIDIVKLEGRVVVLNFWFISCKPCVKEIPELNELVAKYKNEDVVFLALALDKSEVLTKFRERKPFDYKILPRTMPIVKKFGVDLFPTHYVIDKKGLVRLYQKGYGPNAISRIDREIARRLEE